MTSPYLRSVASPELRYHWDVYNGDQYLGRLRHWADDHLWQVVEVRIGPRLLSHQDLSMYGSRDLAMQAIAGVVEAMQ